MKFRYVCVILAIIGLEIGNCLGQYWTGGWSYPGSYGWYNGWSMYGSYMYDYVNNMMGYVINGNYPYWPQY